MREVALDCALISPRMYDSESVCGTPGSESRCFFTLVRTTSAGVLKSDANAPAQKPERNCVVRCASVDEGSEKSVSVTGLTRPWKKEREPK